MENHETLMKDSTADGAAKVSGNIITTVTPERKAEEEKAEQEDAHTDAAETEEPEVSTPVQQETKVKLSQAQHRLSCLSWMKEQFLLDQKYNILPD